MTTSPIRSTCIIHPDDTSNIPFLDIPPFTPFIDHDGDIVMLTCASPLRIAYFSASMGIVELSNHSIDDYLGKCFQLFRGEITITFRDKAI